MRYQRARAVVAVIGDTALGAFFLSANADAAAAEAMAKGVSDPSSPTYGHYLSPKSFTARYAPTVARVKRVSSYLTGQGIKVTGVAGGNLWIDATGSVAQSTPTSAAIHRPSCSRFTAPPRRWPRATTATA